MGPWGGLNSRAYSHAKGCRLHFDLIDQVVEQDKQRIVAVKSVSLAEEYLQDHFPGFAVLPGVMMLETMVQAARRFAASLPDPPRLPLMIKQVRSLRYGNMVRPSQQLRVEVTLRRRDGQTFDFDGRGFVGDASAVQGRFTLEPADCFKQTGRFEPTAN